MIPDRRQLRKQLTRGHLLLAGRKLFGEKGIYESRIEDLTTVAGIAKGTIYGYFEDKEALVLAVTEAAFAELAAFMNAAAGSRRGPERDLALVRAHVEFFTTHPDLMRILHQVRGALKFDRPEWRRLRDALGRYVSELASVLAGAQPPRRLPTRRELDRAELLFGAVSGILSLRASLDGNARARGDHGDVVAAVAAMLGTPAGARRRLAAVKRAVTTGRVPAPRPVRG